MNIRFDVDQAESFRRGVDAPTSIITIDVNPAKIDQKDRDLIADRLHGIDVCALVVSDSGETVKRPRIKAITADYKGLMEAIHKNQKELEAKKMF